MEILRLAAFAYQHQGGNPAGVVIGETLPTEAAMLATAQQVGYSETAFLKPVPGGWRVRYFAPAMEVPFCGHATIALGAALGERLGAGTYPLFLNDSEISVSAAPTATGAFSATLQSPATWSAAAPPAYVEAILHEFQWGPADLDPRFPVYFAGAGAKHLIVVLRDRHQLATMAYPVERVKTLMQQEGLVTLNLLWAETPERFHARNPFPTGGVYEDPATGAAAAALGGYLRDLAWPGHAAFEVLQGFEMGAPSRLLVQVPPAKGAGVFVSGETRHLENPT